MPQHVSVVGYGDMLLARLTTPALTTIRQGKQEKGRLLVASVLDQYASDQSRRLSNELAVRKSCGA